MSTPDSSPPPAISTSIATAFAQALREPIGTDWNAREQSARACILPLFADSSLPEQNVYLGGDALRCYLAVWSKESAWVATTASEIAHRPKLLSELHLGRFGSATLMPCRCEGSVVTVAELPLSQQLSERLAAPTLYLASLTNASRYQARRYPLNIARLAQWVRFQHCARAVVLDLPLTFSGNLSTLAEKIIDGRPDVVGISVNFGELETLASLISLIRPSGIRPRLCLGNVLAAWAEQHVRDICDGFEVTISHSYGEHELETVCGSIFVKDAHTMLILDHRTVPEPETIVVPDELLIGETITANGQISIETSFGCQYSKCTFCPRDHRGGLWKESDRKNVVAVVDYMASAMASLGKGEGRVLSIIDEDAFGTEESRTPDDSPPTIVDVVRAAGCHGIGCEIYARLDQIFNRRRSSESSIIRLEQLRLISPLLRRFFVGVESGSDSQLRRYGKGQSTADIVDALRAGSLLGLPLEFGFITFDPLLTRDELVQNLRFLGRKDILFEDRRDCAAKIDRELRTDSETQWPSGIPVFMKVAYMATELELFANSPFKKLLDHGHPELLRDYDAGFARYNYSFRDPLVSQIADWCRVWTEGTFKSIYRIRLAIRSATTPRETSAQIVGRYRQATFALLSTLAHHFGFLSGDEFTAHTAVGLNGMPIPFSDESKGLVTMKELWKWVVGTNGAGSDIEQPNFTLDTLRRHRED